MGLFEILSPEGAPIYLTNLPVEKSKGQIGQEWAHDDAGLQKFIADYDQPGRALYFCVTRLRNGSPTRYKENVEATNFIWSEVDFKDHPDLAPDEIRRRIETAPLSPTLLVNSGHGFHTYWRLNEAIDATPGPAQQNIEAALKLACDYIGGDANVAEAARLMRLPGTHNRKNGDCIPVEILIDNGRSYELSDLIDFWIEAHACSIR
jgi:hypothetical protein